MSGDTPIEFRAAKKGLSLADWVADRVRHDATICAGAAALALACGAFATLGAFVFTWVVLIGLNTAFCGLISNWLVALPAVAAVAGLFFLQRRNDGDGTEPVKVDAGSRGRITLRLSRLTGNSWLMFLDNPSGEPNPFVRFVTNLFLLAPRLIAVGRRMWLRARQMKSLEPAVVAGGIDALMQSSGRIPLGELIQEFANVDPQRFVSDLTAFDGVILLLSDPPGLTLAPSVAEEYDAWKKEIRKKRRAAEY